MIRILGADGSYSHKSKATSFLIEDSIVIDAGNIIASLEKACCEIEHIFISHTHFDHVVDLPFVIESYFECRKKPLKIYTLSDNIDKLQEYLFNWSIWPNFNKIPQDNEGTPSLQFIPIEFGQTVTINEVEITIIEANHTVPTCGFKIKKNNHSFILSGDTYINQKLIELLNNDKNISSLIIDVSFSSEKEELAKTSKHLTPKLLEQMLLGLKRDDITIYTYHQKPLFIEKIDEELIELNLLKNGGKRLVSGDVIDIFTPVSQRKEVENFNSYRDERSHLTSLFKISQTIQNESNLSVLFSMIVEQAMKFTHADAGTLYILDDEKKELMFKVLHNDSLNIHIRNIEQNEKWPNLPLYHNDKSHNDKLVSVLTALSKKTILINDVYEKNDFDFSGTKIFDKTTGYRSCSMLVVPLVDHENETIGVLQLINKKDLYGDTVPFEPFDQESTEALASQASIAVVNTTLINDLKDSFELFIRTITMGINTKDKETGEHVRKVSIIADMIAKAIHQSNTGKYKDIFYTDEQIKQINLAALLHDVGKISTPEHIMDKNKKLETIVDRITILDERIEILKRDIKIKYLEKELALCKSHQTVPENIQIEESKELAHLDEIRTFLHKSNVGGEYLVEDKILRLQEIAQRSYVFQDQNVQLLRGDELENLSIPRGTLTVKERDIIRNHAKVTVDILGAIKFPTHLKPVPDIACNHHEKLDGTGYPRQLTAEELTLEDRIMILADMFEALSASNRGYKVPNSMNEIIVILKKFMDDGHMDKDLVKFFFESGTYREYAKNELLPEQQDIVSIDFD